MKVNPNIALIETNPGVGGEEAKIWAQTLLSSYLKYAQIKGEGAYTVFKRETGVHRVQRIPTTEKRGRVHTSTAVVLVLPQIIQSNVHINEGDLEWDFFRAGGHGGQNVNKVASAVRLKHTPTGLVVTCSQERFQQANRQLAIALLQSKLYQLDEE